MHNSIGGVMFTLGRKIDMNYKTNKWITIISILVASIGGIITKDFSSGLSIGMGTFLTWALAREVDPKHDLSAFICIAFSSINLFFFKEIKLLEVFYILLTLRLISGITGKKVTVIDILSIFGLALFLSISMKNSIYMITFLISIILIKRIEGIKGRVKTYKSVCIMSLIIIVLEIIYYKYIHISEIRILNIFTVFLSIIFITLILLINFIDVDSVFGDQRNRVDKKRIRYSQIVFSVIVILFSIFTNNSFNNLIIYNSIILGISFYTLKKSIRKS